MDQEPVCVISYNKFSPNVTKAKQREASESKLASVEVKEEKDEESKDKEFSLKLNLIEFFLGVYNVVSTLTIIDLCPLGTHDQ